MAFDELGDFSVVLLNAALLLTYTVYGVVYRLYLSPIASFPGPKLAAVIFWYVSWLQVQIYLG